jgi:hypothetical protein
MGHASRLTALVLEQFLIQARLTKAPVSLRLLGAGSRLLGDMRLMTFHPGSSLQLSGLNARDSVPPEGMPVTLTILLGEEVLTLESKLLPAIQDKSGNTIMRLEWPQDSARLHHRRDVRVAAPDQSPLKVQVTLASRRHDALLMNLTETGVGLALQDALMVDLHTLVEIDAELPDGTLLRCPAEVRHLTIIEGQDYPTRLGLVLAPGPDTDIDSVHRFIQVRRTDRSQSIRKA